MSSIDALRIAVALDGPPEGAPVEEDWQRWAGWRMGKEMEVLAVYEAGGDFLANAPPKVREMFVQKQRGVSKGIAEYLAGRARDLGYDDARWVEEGEAFQVEPHAPVEDEMIASEMMFQIAVQNRRKVEE